MDFTVFALFAIATYAAMGQQLKLIFSNFLSSSKLMYGLFILPVNGFLTFLLFNIRRNSYIEYLILLYISIEIRLYLHYYYQQAVHFHHHQLVMYFLSEQSLNLHYDNLYHKCLAADCLDLVNFYTKFQSFQQLTLFYGG